MDYIRWLRAHTGPALLPLVYATAIIQDSDGQILMQHRADFGAAWWGLPGGLLEPGESLEECLRREAWEETGLRIEPLRLMGSYSSLRYAVTYPNGDRVQQITACYLCRILDGSLNADGDEIVHQEFFPPNALPPTSSWYTDMLAHALDPARPTPYFDPPEHQPADTPYPSLMALRQVVGSAPVIWMGANAIVLNAEGQVLLQHRADFDVWGLPAGALDVGETLAHTARRETLEETGLHVEPLELLTIFAGRQITYPNGHQLYPVGHSFLCRLIGGEPRPNHDDSVDVGFFPLDALPPMSPTSHERLQQVLAKVQ
jgi:8-oxo-dGTP pyrophosphatase MutT (NUDIX family)